MSKPKPFANFILLVVTTLVFNAGVSAQNNLTAKANSFQPQPLSAPVESDRIKDGLAGPVRRVRTEVAKLLNANGRPMEDKRVVLETASYDTKGGKTENQYFPIAGSTLTGKEVYKYDEKGNISEMTLLNADGTLLGKEVYKYDYDNVGNWTKMTTSVAVVEGGKVTFEPSEVTYRSITYYLDENMLKMAQPASSPVKVDAGATLAKTNSENRAQPLSKPTESPTGAGNHKAPALPAVNTTTTRSNALTSSVLPTSGTGTTAAKGTVVVLDAEPPASPSPKPILKPVSGGVLNGRALTLPAPSYPDTARRMRTEGTVTVQVVLDENGKVISAQATGGPMGLREAATQAAMRAKFSPTKLSGQPVKVTGIITYKFSLGA